jgi:hypothetical protein
VTGAPGGAVSTAQPAGEIAGDQVKIPNMVGVTNIFERDIKVPQGEQYKSHSWCTQFVSVAFKPRVFRDCCPGDPILTSDQEHSIKNSEKHFKEYLIGTGLASAEFLDSAEGQCYVEATLVEKEVRHANSTPEGPSGWLGSGAASSERRRIEALEREIRELRQANELLRKESARAAH